MSGWGGARIEPDTTRACTNAPVRGLPRTQAASLDAAVCAQRRFAFVERGFAVGPAAGTRRVFVFGRVRRTR